MTVDTTARSRTACYLLVDAPTNPRASVGRTTPSPRRSPLAAVVVSTPRRGSYSPTAPITCWQRGGTGGTLQAEERDSSRHDSSCSTRPKWAAHDSKSLPRRPPHTSSSRRPRTPCTPRPREARNAVRAVRRKEHRESVSSAFLVSGPTTAQGGKHDPLPGHHGEPRGLCRA